MRVAPARRLPDRTDVDDVNVRHAPLERNVTAAAHDDVAGLVTEQRDELVVGHVVAERFRRIERRAVHDEHRVPRLDRQTRRGRQLPEPRDDELPELGLYLPEALDALALLTAGCGKLLGIDLRESPVAHALHAKSSVLDEQLPHGERLRPWENQISARYELVPAVPARFVEHGFERSRVPVDVGDAEEPHAEAGCRPTRARQQEPFSPALGLRARPHLETLKP